MEDFMVGKVVINFLRTTGLFPFKRKPPIVPNRRGLIYAKIMLIFLFLVQFLNVITISSVANLTIFMYLECIVNTFGYGCCCFLATFILYMRFNRIGEMLNQIADFWGSFRLDEAKHKKSPLVLLLRWNFFCTCLLLLGSIALSSPYFLHASAKYKLTMVLFVFWNNNILGCDYLFMAIAVNGYFMLKCVNRSFREFCWSLWRTRNDDVVGRTSPENASRLRLYYNEYADVLDLLNDLNECFSEVNCISFILSANGIIFMAVLFVKRISPTDTEELINLFDMGYALYFVISKCVCSLLIITKIADEIKYGLTLFHRLYTDNDDLQVEYEVEILSLQLLHRRVEFTACGFFKLDFSVLLSMLGFVTTQAVILIQFETARVNASFIHRTNQSRLIII